MNFNSFCQNILVARGREGRKEGWDWVADKWTYSRHVPFSSHHATMWDVCGRTASLCMRTAAEGIKQLQSRNKNQSTHPSIDRSIDRSRGANAAPGLGTHSVATIRTVHSRRNPSYIISLYQQQAYSLASLCPPLACLRPACQLRGSRSHQWTISPR